jgi:hypothetical protein
LFNPRADIWSEHFEATGPSKQPALSCVGKHQSDE